MILRTGLTALMLMSGAAMVQHATPIAPMKAHAARAELGKRLFHDDRLSGDTSLACASCHQPDKAFTDGKALSDACTGAAYFRNALTFANVGYRAA